MKTQITLLFSCLFITIFSFAQTKATLKTDKIKVWGNCGMCKTTIEKAAKNAGASYALWNEDAKILTVKYATSKTSVAKIEKKVASVGYDTQNETAPEEVYNNLHGCCQYDRKATEVKESTSMNCCKDKASCKKDCCTKADMSCCTGKDAKHDCCKDGKSCCSAPSTTEKATAMSCCKDKASCKKDCCTKADMSCCTGKDAKHDCCKDGKSCCAK